MFPHTWLTFGMYKILVKLFTPKRHPFKPWAICGSPFRPTEICSSAKDIMQKLGEYLTSNCDSKRKLALIVYGIAVIAGLEMGSRVQAQSTATRITFASSTLPAPEGEETLDASWTSGIAAHAKIRIYATVDLKFTHLDQAYQRIINELPSPPTLHQVSSVTQETNQDHLL
jgi:hypothetical protein